MSININDLYNDPEFQATVIKTVQKFAIAEADLPLFENCTDVCKDIRSNLPERVKAIFEVYIVKGSWKTQFTSSSFRLKYSKRYPGGMQSTIQHEWLAFSKKPFGLDEDNIRSHDQFDPSYCQFCGSSWKFEACMGDFTQKRIIDRVVNSKYIDSVKNLNTC